MCFIDITERDDLKLPHGAANAFSPSNAPQRNYKLERELMLRAKVELRLLATLRERRGPYKWLPHAVRDGNFYRSGMHFIVAKTHQTSGSDLHWVKKNNRELQEYIRAMRDLSRVLKDASGLDFITFVDDLIKQSFFATREWARAIDDFRDSNDQLRSMLNISNGITKGLENSIRNPSNNYLGTILRSDNEDFRNEPVYDGLNTPLVLLYAKLNALTPYNATKRLMEIENIDDNIFLSSKLFKQDSWYQTKYINQALMNNYLKLYMRKHSWEKLEFYDFYSESGTLIARVEERIHNTGVKSDSMILLPITFWEKTGDEVLFPLHVHFGKEIPLYNLQLLQELPTADIFICDTLEKAKYRQKNFAIEENGVPMPAVLAGYKPIWMAWPSWPGDNSEAYIDFSPLKERRVFYLIEAEDKASLKDLYMKAVKVYPKLKIIDNLCFIEKIDQPRFMDRKGFVKRVHAMGLKMDLARDDIVVEQGLAVRSAANLGKVKELEYVLKPIIPENSITLAYSTYGIGKSFAALSFAYAITQGVDVCDRLKVGTPGKILYIDSEMGEETMTERITYMEKIYGADKAKQENFLWYSAASEAHLKTLNLEDLQDQNLVDKMLKNAENSGTKNMPVSLLVLDNISTLTSGSNTHSAWMKIFNWLYRLKPNCSVLILHHENRAGGYLGTVLKGITVDCKIHLEPVELKTREVEFRLVVEKGRRIYGKDKEPFDMGINLNSTEPHWTTSSENEISEREKLKSMTPREQLKYLDKLNKSLKSNDKVAAFIGISVSTLYNWRSKLPEIGIP